MYVRSISQDSVAGIVTKLWAGGSRALVLVGGTDFPLHTFWETFVPHSIHTVHWHFLPSCVDVVNAFQNVTAINDPEVLEEYRESIW